RAECHGDQRVLVHHRLVDALVGQQILARVLDRLGRRVGNHRRQLSVVHCVHLGRRGSDADRPESQRCARFDDAVDVLRGTRGLRRGAGVHPPARWGGRQGVPPARRGAAARMKRAPDAYERRASAFTRAHGSLHDCRPGTQWRPCRARRWPPERGTGSAARCPGSAFIRWCSRAGFATGGTWRIASAYFRNVSTEAMTTRASTVRMSIPTSATQTQTSMTTPLSRMRSTTSARFVPPTLSIAMGDSLCSPFACRAPCARSSELHAGTERLAGQRSDLQLERSHFLSQRVALCRAKLPARRKAPIELPPVEAELLGLAQRADEQPDPDGEQLDFGERDLDVSCDHESLVEDTVENLHETCRAIVPLGVSRAQGFGGIHVAADSTHGLL